MGTAQLIASIIAAVVGTGGIASIIIAVFSIRKYKAEARSIEQQTETARRESEQKMNEYIRTQLKELSDTHRAESEELRKQNRELSEEIVNLNNKVNQLMSWIVGDNLTYRSWLENELRKLKPDIKFPKCRPAPGFTNVVIDQAIETPETTDTDTNEEE